MSSKTLKKFLADEIADLKNKGVFRPLRIVDGHQAPWTVIDGKKVINLSSNNYLNLTNHPKVIEAARKATLEYGAGAGAVRTIIGTMRLHDELEKKLAAFKKVEAVLVFQSGFCANQGSIGSIMTKDDLIFSDRLSHASIIDGCRLSRAKIVVYEHNDPKDLQAKLEEYRENPGKKLIVTDSVFSMDGDIAPLPELVDVAEKYDAFFFVDDAHASGVLGSCGRGSVDHFGLHGKVDIQMGTLSKAIGVMGGYIAGSRDLIDYMIHRGRPMLFSTAHPPSVPASVIAAIDILQNEPEHMERLWSNVEFWKTELRNIGFNIGNSVTPITPVIIGEEAASMKFSDRLMELGVFAQGIVFPTVPRGTGRVRTIITAGHSKDDLIKALVAFQKAGKEFGAIS